MKTVFSLFLTAFSLSSLFSQEAANPPINKEIGLNFTRFLDEAIDFGGSSTLLNPYLLTYKKLDATGKGLRLGAGFSFSRSKGNDGSGNFFTDDASSFFTSGDLRFGSEQQRKISGKWMFYYGFDGLFRFNYSDLTTSSDFGGEVKIKTMNYGAGLGPVLGAQFMISERVGLSTEASFYLVQSFRNETTKFDGGSSDDKQKSNSTRLDFSVPTNIFIFFRL